MKRVLRRVGKILAKFHIDRMWLEIFVLTALAVTVLFMYVTVHDVKNTVDNVDTRSLLNKDSREQFQEDSIHLNCKILDDLGDDDPLCEDTSTTRKN